MMPRFAARSADCALALALVVSACASETIVPGTPREVTETKINPFEVQVRIALGKN